MSTERVIKFRAWFDGKMYLSPDEIDHLGSWFDSHWPGSISKLRRENGKQVPVLQQFTGLLDKNGKEIYEGDVVNFAIKERNCDCNKGERLSAGNSYCPGCGKKVELSDFVQLASVEYNKAGFALFYTDGKDNSYRWSYHAAESFIAWIEVIGHIYEKSDSPIIVS
jgi:uncharacterized phage protein (TIGR01671 family)